MFQARQPTASIPPSPGAAAYTPRPPSGATSQRSSLQGGIPGHPSLSQCSSEVVSRLQALEIQLIEEKKRRLMVESRIREIQGGGGTAATSGSSKPNIGGGGGGGGGMSASEDVIVDYHPILTTPQLAALNQTYQRRASSASSGGAPKGGMMSGTAAAAADGSTGEVSQMPRNAIMKEYLSAIQQQRATEGGARLPTPQQGSRFPSKSGRPESAPAPLPSTLPSRGGAGLTALDKHALLPPAYRRQHENAEAATPLSPSSSSTAPSISTTIASGMGGYNAIATEKSHRTASERDRRKPPLPAAAKTKLASIASHRRNVSRRRANAVDVYEHQLRHEARLQRLEQFNYVAMPLQS